MAEQGRSDPYPSYDDTTHEALVKQERMKELTADGRMSQEEAAYQIAREDNEQLVKINIYEAEQKRNSAAEPEKPLEPEKSAERDQEPEAQQQAQPENTEERTLSFFEDREPNSPNYAQLRKEQSDSVDSPDHDNSKTEDQSQKPERSLTFFEDRNPAEPGRSR